MNISQRGKFSLTDEEIADLGRQIAKMDFGALVKNIDTEEVINHCVYGKKSNYAKLLEAKRYLKSRGLGTVERITPRDGK